MSQRSRARQGNVHVISASDRKKTTEKKVAKRFDAREFYIPASEGENDSLPIGFRVPKRYKAAIDEVIYSHKIRPYRNPGYLLRHALDRHLHWLHEIDPELIGGFIMDIDFINEAAREAEAMVELMKVVQRIEKVVEAFTSHNLRPLAVKTIYRLRKRAADMQDPVFRKWMLDELNRRFGSIMKSKSNEVDLTVHDDGPTSPEEEEMHSWAYNDNEEALYEGLGLGESEDGEAEEEMAE